MAQDSSSISRHLGHLEVFFKRLADLGAPLQREHWAVHLAVRLNFIGGSKVDMADPEYYLRRAWQAVRHQYPAIGSTVSPPSPSNNHTHVERLTITSFDADTWANDTFIVDRNYVNANALFSDLRPSPTSMCYWLPSSSEVVIRSSHWRLDGIGIVMLCHKFMTALAMELQTGPISISPGETRHLPAPIQSHPLPPNIEDLGRNRSVGGPHIHEDLEFNPRLELGADALVAEFLRGVPSIGLPTRANSEQIPPGASARSQIHLDIVTTAEITTACRVQGFSFTGAVHAAIVIVTAQFPQYPLSKAYTAFFPVDLRKFIVATHHTIEDELLCGLYFSGLPICIDGMASDREGNAAKGFDQIAREMTAVYRRDLTNFWQAPDGQMISLLELAEPYLTRTTALFGAQVPEGFPPIQTPDLSGLGKVETLMQREYESGPETPKVELVDIWIATEMINKSIQFHVWSWKDELSIGASYNKSFYEENFVVRVLDLVAKELQTGLGVRKADR